MKRPIAVAVALLVAGSVLAPAAFGTDATAAQSADATSVDSCTVITDSGAYELTDDVGSDVNETCIEIRADDVVLDGNGHAVEGPGADAGDGNDAYRGIYVNFSDGVTIRNVEVAGWSPGIRTEAADVTLEDAVVRDSDVGIFLEETGPTNLSNVTVADNDGAGIDTHRTGNLRAVDVTLDGNDVGLQTWDAHDLHLEDSRIVDHDGNGVNLHHHSSLTLTDVTVSGNGGDGVNAIAHEGFRVDLTMDGGTVSDNGGDGIAAIASAHVALDGVTVENNADLELNGAQIADMPGRNVTASDLDVGPSATTAFEGESLNLEPVDREALPDLPAGESAAGDGLNVSGPVEGPVGLELDVDTDDDRADLWRHDGDDWEAVEEDLDASDGTIEATVDDNGTYAPVAADEEDESDGTDDSDETDDNDGTGSDGEGDADAGTPTPSDQEKSKSTPTPTASDEDGTESTPTPTQSGDGGGGSSSASSDSTDDSSTTGGSATDAPAATDADAGTATASPTAGNASTSTPDSDQQQTDTGTDGSTAGTDGDVQADEEDDEVTTFGAGPGFGPVVALLALLGGPLLLRRHR